MLPIVAASTRSAAARGPTRAAPLLSDLREADLPALLTAFYADVAGDPLLAPHFAPLDMAAHIPRIADFWATVLFHADRYRGSAFQPHAAMPGLTAEHFGRWLDALERTVDARHQGEGAVRMKALGHRIAYSMQLRLGIAPTAPYVLDARAVVPGRDLRIDAR
jgi:hemoglobin